MNDDFAAVMHRALNDVRAMDTMAATRRIQEALRLHPVDAGAPAQTAPSAHWRPSLPSDAIRRPLSNVIAELAANSGRARSAKLPSIADGARYEWRSHSAPAGARDYRLYIPASIGERPRGLIVMLHGCTQNPDDFACGVAMHEFAERDGLLVAYPAQTRAHNAQGCWNWFRSGDQTRGAGEPAILASLTQALAQEFDIERGRIFVAGLSAGAAMAAILAEAYPEVFAALGMHSGLPVGCAQDAMSAFAAMRGAYEPPRMASMRRSRPVRTIVFHGAADAIVHPSNSERIVDRVQSELSGVRVREEAGVSPGGRHYVRTIVHEADTEAGAAPALERWIVEGLGHAWSGGSAIGSYTDPSGPNASAEMVRFFLEDARPIQTGEHGSAPWR